MILAGSILFLCCISLHRFIGVCYPVRSLYWLSARRARLVSVAVWACVLFCQAPVLYFSRTRWLKSSLYLSFTYLKSLWSLHFLLHANFSKSLIMGCSLKLSTQQPLSLSSLFSFGAKQSSI